MIELDDLRDKQASFETVRQEYERDFKKLEQLRTEFIKKFPIENMGNLPMDKYVVGKEDSFCYWLETKLASLGRIQGGSPAPNKFGVYYGKTNKDKMIKYRSLPKWGESPDEAYKKVRQEIINLLEAGSEGNIKSIKKNALSPMFKGKILATYFPNDYLNIFSEHYVDHYLDQLGLSDQLEEDLSVEEKRHVLLTFKQKDSVMNNWTNFEFMRFLIAEFGRPANEESIPGELKKYVSSTYPPIKDVKPSFIGQPSFGDVMKQPQQDPYEAGKHGNVDFDEKRRRAKKLGDRGESIVLRSETQYLKSIGRADLEVIHVAAKSSSAGYDILSYDDKGNRKHVEVKATTAKVGQANFIISSNELKTAGTLTNYFIYLVFEADTTRPKIIPIRFNELSEEKMKLTPINYRVMIKPII